MADISDKDRAVFDLLTASAVARLRCPTNDEIGSNTSSAVGRLARAGHIRVEVYSHNYRVVEIMLGEHKGARTAEDPKGGKPYRVVDHNGDQWVTRSAKTGAPVTRHVERKIDGSRDLPPAPVTLQRLSFLEREDT